MPMCYICLYGKTLIKKDINICSLSLLVQSGYLALIKIGVDGLWDNIVYAMCDNIITISDH